MNEPCPTIAGVAHDLNNQIMILLFALDRITGLYPDLIEATMAFRAAEQCGTLVALLLPPISGPIEAAELK